MTQGERITALETHRERDIELLTNIDARLVPVETMVKDIHRGFRAFIWIAKTGGALGLLIAFVKGVVPWSDVVDAFKDLA